MKIKRNYWTIPGLKEILTNEDYIIHYIERNTGVKINTNTRLRDVVHARQLAMYIIKEKTKLTLAQIGDRCGGKDHATVAHAIKKVKDNMKYDKYFRYKYGKLLKRFGLM